MRFALSFSLIFILLGVITSQVDFSSAKDIESASALFARGTNRLIADGDFAPVYESTYHSYHQLDDKFGVYASHAFNNRSVRNWLHSLKAHLHKFAKIFVSNVHFSLKFSENHIKDMTNEIIIHLRNSPAKARYYLAIVNIRVNKILRELERRAERSGISQERTLTTLGLMYDTKKNTIVALAKSLGVKDAEFISAISRDDLDEIDIIHPREYDAVYGDSTPNRKLPKLIRDSEVFSSTVMPVEAFEPESPVLPDFTSIGRKNSKKFLGVDKAKAKKVFNMNHLFSKNTNLFKSLNRIFNEYRGFIDSKSNEINKKEYIYMDSEASDAISKFIASRKKVISPKKDAVISAYLQNVKIVENPIEAEASAAEEADDEYESGEELYTRDRSYDDDINASHYDASEVFFFLLMCLICPPLVPFVLIALIIIVLFNILTMHA